MLSSMLLLKQMNWKATKILQLLVCRKLMESNNLSKKWVHGESKTYLQLPFIDYDGILYKDLVIHTNARRWSEDMEDFSKDVLLII